MSAVATGLTIVQFIQLGMSFMSMLGKTSGMSKEELDKMHKEVMDEFDKSDPEALIKILKEKMK